MEMFLNAAINMVGVFLGAFLAYIFTKRWDVQKKGERLRVVVPMLLRDLENNLQDIEFAMGFYKHYLKLEQQSGEDSEKNRMAMNKVRGIIELRLQFKKDIFLALLNDMLLLDTNMAQLIVKRYQQLESTKLNFAKAFSEASQETISREIEVKLPFMKTKIAEIAAELAKIAPAEKSAPEVIFEQNFPKTS